ncbi:MAG TPA: hypothetical protein VNW97_13180 [Candidatus Saccharimonadales bacterium]|nr:hypothetical protein [Candidatus Saccharimonadales bacterium]
MARFLTDLWNPAPRFVTALLLIAFGTSVYQQRLIADLKKPRQEARVYLSELTRSKGNEKVISVPRHSRLALESGFLQRDEFKSYRALILTEPDKRTTYTVPLHLEEDEVSITIGLPPEALPEGIYSLAIQGQQSDGQWKTLEEGKKEAGGIFRISVNTLKEPSWKAALGNGGPELRLKRNMT